jgi:hypothetical protein
MRNLKRDHHGPSAMYEAELIMWGFISVQGRSWHSSPGCIYS